MDTVVTQRYAPGSDFFGRKVPIAEEPDTLAPGCVFFGRNVQTDVEESERMENVALIAKLKQRFAVGEKFMEEMTKNIKMRHTKTTKGIQKLRLLELGKWRKMKRQNICIQTEIASIEDKV